MISITQAFCQYHRLGAMYFTEIVLNASHSKSHELKGTTPKDIMNNQELSLNELDLVTGGFRESSKKDIFKLGPIIIHGPNDPNGPIGGWPDGIPQDIPWSWPR